MQTNLSRSSVSEPLVSDCGERQFGDRISCHAPISGSVTPANVAAWVRISNHRIGSWVVVLALSAGASLMAQPSITGAANNASYPRPGLLNYGIAQGSLFAIFGTGLAAPGTQSEVSNFPIPREMAGVTVKLIQTGMFANAPLARC